MVCKSSNSCTVLLRGTLLIDGCVLHHLVCLARFHVRVLVPCYKEPLSVVAATLAAAQQALLPAYTKRTM
jgi:hypothetical protein